MFHEATKRWFFSNFHGATAVQEQGWHAISKGEHALLLAPTGSGKTLAAFLWALDRLFSFREPQAEGVRVLYVSPLKALVYDVERNLRAPLVGIGHAALELGDPSPLPRVDLRTGDTSSRDRQRQQRTPAEILVTTPESLYLMLGGKAKETLRTVESVIIDEVHALAATKRGAHLALSLERLALLCARDPQRIGLSATARPTETIARFLGGDRKVTVVDCASPPRIDLKVMVPVDDMTRPAENPLETSTAPDIRSVWPAVYRELLALIQTHHTTLIFVNSRGLAEKMAQKLNDAYEESSAQEPEAATPQHAAEEEALPLVMAHHGSLSHARRQATEDALKEGRIRAIVATSSLELGIDMGAIDLVVMVESPGAVSRGLQRLGRAGHGVGEVSVGRIVPKHRGDLLEATVIAKRMKDGEIEPLQLVHNPLDVLSQQIVATCSEHTVSVQTLQDMVRRCANFQQLPDSAFFGVLDMLSGKYPSQEFNDFRTQLVWDRDRDELTPVRGAKMLSLINGGTIPDRGLFTVHLGHDGPRIGELDEEMVHETTPGQTFTLGASTWRVVEVTRDRVIVAPAPGEVGKLPFWRGDGPGRPSALGRALGRFVRETADACERQPEAEVTAALERDYGLDARAAVNLVSYLQEQKETTGTVPTDKSITVERFRDELGDARICILSPFGARIHAPWAMAIQAMLSQRAGFEMQTMWNDDGIALSLPDVEEDLDLALLIPSADEVEDRIVDQLSKSSLFASAFRENAARALLLPRRRPGKRAPLWQQRLRAARLLAVAIQFPAFPIVVETYRSCLSDYFDLPALQQLLRLIERREIRITEVETKTASPFARSLVFAYAANYLYEGDAPLAERRAQALALDRSVLRELLGGDELRELLDAEVIATVESELQGVAEEYQATHPDALHHLLRRIGDLTSAELSERCSGNAEQWVDMLQRDRRILSLQVKGVTRWIAIEDAALYRDAVGWALPQGISKAHLEPARDPLKNLIKRYSRTHGPFTSGELKARYGIAHRVVDETLSSIAKGSEVIRGAFLPQGNQEEWCDREVLARIKRRTLAKLRGEVAPVDARTLARFLPLWQGVGGDDRSPERLEEALEQLEGLAVPFSELETQLLPERVPGFLPRMLDDLGASGYLVWVGHGSLGKGDGKVALYRRDQVARLLDPPETPEDLSSVHKNILSILRSRGACFLGDLIAAQRETSEADLRAALWDLAFRGLITSDTFEALRQLRSGTSASKARSSKRGRPRIPGRRGLSRASAKTLSGGRWGLVEHLIFGEVPNTERVHARAVMLLSRYGIVSRQVAAIEHLPGGFSPIYQVLRHMEEIGKVRRGHFVEGLVGAQFAFPGAVDRMRALREDDQTVAVLSAVDPANPCGVFVPWPDPSDNHRGPRRAAGNSVVIVDGHPALYLEIKAKRLRTFPAAKEASLLKRALAELHRLAARAHRTMLRVDWIDGKPARESPLLEALRAAGFEADHRGVFLEMRP
ncbi:MAG: DEAD/DEAH box helicase [Myxococcota bacterium]